MSVKGDNMVNKVALECGIMVNFRTKRSEILFESVMIYLLCWSSPNKEWKLSDFYGNNNKPYIVSGKKNLYKTTLSRIMNLKKVGVPVNIEKLEKNSAQFIGTDLFF